MIEQVRLHWRRELLYPGLAAMESCWLYPWLMFLLGDGRKEQYVPLLALYFTLLFALYITRLLHQRVASLLAQRIVTIVLAPLSTLLLLRIYVYAGYGSHDMSWLVQFVQETGDILQAIRPSLVIFCAGLYLWWRGISLAQGDLDVSSVGLAFRVGIVAFFWLFLVQLFGFPANATTPVFVYFSLGLIVIGLARIHGVSRSHVGIRSPFNASWLGILVSATLCVSALSILSARLLSLRTIAAVLNWLHPALVVLGVVVYPLLALLALLLDFVLTLLIHAFNALFGAKGLEFLGLEHLAERLREIQPIPTTLGKAPLVIQVLKWSFLGFLLLVALATLAFSIDRRLREMQARRSAEHATVRESKTVGKDVRDAIESRWRRLYEELQAQLARLRGQEYVLTSIRQIYASLVKLAAASGFPRQEAETPYEYAITLRRAFPESSSEVALITDAYVRAHYGEQRFAPEYVQRVRNAWLAIRNRREEIRGSESG